MAKKKMKKTASKKKASRKKSAKKAAKKKAVKKAASRKRSATKKSAAKKSVAKKSTTKEGAAKPKSQRKTKKRAAKKRATKKTAAERRAAASAPAPASGRKVSAARKSTAKRKSAGGSKKSARKKTANQTGSKGNSTFAELFEKAAPEVQRLGKTLRKIVREELPDAEELVWYGGWNIALYQRIDPICGIGPMSDRCNFYLKRGAHLRDPDELLEGTGKGIRHVKVYVGEEIPEEGLRKLIRAGARLDGQ